MSSYQEDRVSFDEEEQTFSFFVDAHHLHIVQYVTSQTTQGDFLDFVNMGLSAILDAHASDYNSNENKPKCEYLGQEKNLFDIISDQKFPDWVDHYSYLTNQIKLPRYEVTFAMNEETKGLLVDLLFVFNKYEKSVDVMMLFVRFLVLLIFFKQKNLPINLYTKLPKQISKRNGGACFMELNLFDMYDFPIATLNS